MRLFSPSLKIAIHHTLPSGSQLEGTLTFKGGLLIEGSVLGCLNPQGAKSSVTVGERGVVEIQTLEVDTLVINGRVNAKSLKARRVVLGATSKVVGDIEAQTIEIHTGAVFDGRVVSVGAPVEINVPPPAKGTASQARQRLETLTARNLATPTHEPTTKQPVEA